MEHKHTALVTSPGRGNVGDGPFVIFMKLTHPHTGKVLMELESIGYRNEIETRDALGERRRSDKVLLDSTTSMLRNDLENQQAKDRRDGVPAEQIEERTKQVRDLLDNMTLPDYVAYELRPIAETPVSALPAFRVAGDEPEDRAA
jgi:hypothetical protein